MTLMVGHLRLPKLIPANVAMALLILVKLVIGEPEAMAIVLLNVANTVPKTIVVAPFRLLSPWVLQPHLFPLDLPLLP